MTGRVSAIGCRIQAKATDTPARKVPASQVAEASKAVDAAAQPGQGAAGGRPANSGPRYAPDAPWMHMVQPAPEEIHDSAEQDDGTR